MAALRTPNSVKAATGYAERFAELDGAIGDIEAERNRTIAAANAAADLLAEPLLAERDAIREKLAAWWPLVAAALTQGKRKSIELGGCLIGSRAGRASLAIEGEPKLVAAALEKHQWAAPLLRTKIEIDRAAVLKAIDGAHKRALANLGFRKVEPADVFVLERFEQAGTLAGAE